MRLKSAPIHKLLQGLPPFHACRGLRTRSQNGGLLKRLLPESDQPYFMALKGYWPNWGDMMRSLTKGVIARQAQLVNWSSSQTSEPDSGRGARPCRMDAGHGAPF
ncbi:MAG: hypothetical protein Ct9H300mP14_05590 [Gammaproteobacteria bacterium]|nr:MAG: hypothetical protein Ct9H300mP14_05590 [Gammaproteobacteria bacterium]